uniref:Uncharacterized protein n=1 Tax=Tanacetum cinerariifolium TaxID=118510 RepID=A0A6L2P796_TANCI|nr:hypothetical protein [Tanacetum cinerariifolium]
MTQSTLTTTLWTWGTREWNLLETKELRPRDLMSPMKLKMIERRESERWSKRSTGGSGILLLFPFRGLLVCVPDWFHYILMLVFACMLVYLLPAVCFDLCLVHVIPQLHAYTCWRSLWKQSLYSHGFYPQDKQMEQHMTQEKLRKRTLQMGYGTITYNLKVALVFIVRFDGIHFEVIFGEKQKKLMKKEMKEEDKLNKEADNIVKWVKQASNRRTDISEINLDEGLVI